MDYVAANLINLDAFPKTIAEAAEGDEPIFSHSLVLLEGLDEETDHALDLVVWHGRAYFH